MIPAKTKMPLWFRKKQKKIKIKQNEKSTNDVDGSFVFGVNAFGPKPCLDHDLLANAIASKKKKHEVGIESLI